MEVFIFTKNQLFIASLAISLVFFIVGTICGSSFTKNKDNVQEPVKDAEVVTYSEAVSKTEPFEVITTTYKAEFDDYDKELLALVTAAEAEGECEEGKRLVIDTVLNRYYSDEFPDTIREVIYQKNQFTAMWTGRAESCIVTEDIRELVEEEIRHRKNSEVLYFQAENYSDYGTPLFKVGNHYFSKE